MSAFGWTIDYINDFVTLPQAFLLLDTLQDYPSVPLMLKGFLGIKKKKKKKPEVDLVNKLAGIGGLGYETAKHSSIRQIAVKKTGKILYKKD